MNRQAAKAARTWFFFCIPTKKLGGLGGLAVQSNA
jgi:hypothetical protein